MIPMIPMVLFYLCVRSGVDAEPAVEDRVLKMFGDNGSSEEEEAAARLKAEPICPQEAKATSLLLLMERHIRHGGGVGSGASGSGGGGERSTPYPVAGVIGEGG